MATSLLDLDASGLAALLARREVSAREVTELYLRRAQELNEELRAVIELNPRALEIADELDRSEVRGPLHGVPVLLKDNIDTADELHTSAGAWNLAGHRATRDAPLAAALRAAGALILGKAGMTEWANFMTIGMPNGFSSRGGQVVNPWGAAFDVGGSSSGSGAAVAARLCPVAVGTETSGSILSPATSNGVFGLKPTVGRISRGGIIPIASSQDTAGPLTRSVRDAELLLRVMSGPDPEDLATLPAPAYVPGGAHTVKGTRLGVGRQAFAHLSSEEREVLEGALGQLRHLGAVVEDADLPTWSELEQGGLEVLVYEFKRDLDRYLSGVQDGPRSLREVIAQNEAHPDRAPYGQLLLLAAEATSGTLREEAYLQARRRDLDRARDRGLDVLFGEQGLDAWLTPGNHAAHVGAKAGYPSLCIPVGRTPPGQPVGLTLTGPAWSEERLLSYGAALEEALGPWQSAR